MRARLMQGAVVALITLAAACGREKAPERAEGMPMSMDTTRRGGGMGMAMPGVAMMPAMRAYMDSMTKLAPAEMRARMAQHQERMSRMLDAMGGDMRMMNVATDTAWNALADSVRRDLADLPGLSGVMLEQRMRAHAARVERLLTRHGQMMR